MGGFAQPRRSGKVAMKAEWLRWLRGRDPSTVYVDFSEPPQLPHIAAGQQVIDRRTGETWTAVEWTGDLALKVRRLTPGHNSTWFNYAALPWRDVIPAGRARKGRA